MFAVIVIQAVQMEVVIMAIILIIGFYLYLHYILNIVFLFSISCSSLTAFYNPITFTCKE